MWPEQRKPPGERWGQASMFCHVEIFYIKFILISSTLPTAFITNLTCWVIVPSPLCLVLSVSGVGGSPAPPPPSHVLFISCWNQIEVSKLELMVDSFSSAQLST